MENRSEMIESRSGGMRMRPMGVGDVVDETFRLYRRHFLSFVTAMAVVSVPAALLSAGLSIALGTSDLQDRIAQGAFPVRPGQTPSFEALASLFAVLAVAGVLLGTISVLAYLLSGGAVVRLASDAALGRRPDVGAAYRAALGRLRPLLLASFLTGLAAVLLSVTVIGIPIAVYFGLGWSLFFQAIMVERVGGVAGMRRGSALVGGHRWRVFGIFLVTGLLVYILTAVPAGIVGALLGAFLALNELTPELRATVEVVNAFMSALGQSLFGALSWITSTVVYYELRVRKEAFDLERLAERAEASTGEAGVFPPAYTG